MWLREKLPRAKGTSSYWHSKTKLWCLALNWHHKVFTALGKQAWPEKQNGHCHPSTGWLLLVVFSVTNLDLLMSDCWKDMKYPCYERKVDSMKRNTKERRAEANWILLMKKPKIKKTLWEKEKPLKNNLKETANSRAYEYHCPLAAATLEKAMSLKTSKCRILRKE